MARHDASGGQLRRPAPNQILRSSVPTVVLSTALSFLTGRELVAHGGNLQLESQPGKQGGFVGTEFRHRSSLVVVDRAGGELQNLGRLVDRAAQTRKTNDFFFSRGKCRCHCFVPGRM